MAKHGQIRPYDFRLPDKFSKDEMRGFDLIFSHFARLCTSFLIGQMRKNPSIEHRDIAQRTFGLLFDQDQGHTMAAVFSAEPLPGKGLVVMSQALALTLVDQLLGGEGTVAQARALTDIEVGVMRKFIGRLMHFFGESLREYLSQAKPQVESVESSLLHAQVMAPSEIVVDVRLAFSLEGSELGAISLWVPFTMMEPVAAGFAGDGGGQVAAASPWDLDDVPVVVRAELGHARLRLREVLALEPGDVLSLGTRVKHPLKLSIGGKPKFVGRAGQVGRELGFYVEHLMREVDGGGGEG